MTALSTFSTDNNGRPIASFSTSSIKQVEPLGGTVDINKLMEAFPEAVYQRGQDSHLYKFVTALCGDAGMGYLAKQSYVARLSTEAENISFTALDTLYTNQFSFRRLKSEIYSYNTDVDALTETEWDEIARKDNSFRQRMQDFFTATTFGTSPTGMAYAARAGSGVECDIIESYKAIFDTYSDDPLGLDITSDSMGHFLIQSRILSRTGEPDPTITYSADWQRSITYSADRSGISTSTPLPVTSFDAITATEAWDNSETHYYLQPDIERNLIALVDWLRPVGASMSVVSEQQRLTSRAITNAFSSSRRFMPARFVTGRDDITWPDLDTTQGYFIVSGVETEAPRLPGGAWERPTVFQTIEGVDSYTDDGLYDSAFNTADFPASLYESVHTGLFDPTITSIYPLLSQVPLDVSLTESRAIAAPATPIFITARGM